MKEKDIMKILKKDLRILYEAARNGLIVFGLAYTGQALSSGSFEGNLEASLIVGLGYFFLLWAQKKDIKVGELSKKLKICITPII